MNVAFRVDASSNIGIGHLMRCLALSEELRRRGHTCYFVSKIDSGELISEIEKNNIHFQINPNATLNEDAEKLIKYSNENNIDWIITDHYGMDASYIEEIKQNNFKVLSVDDNAQIHYYSDIVLNQNIGSEKLRYSSEKHTKFLLGPEYAIIRDQLLRRGNKAEGNKVKKILIMLGGTDKDNFILKIIKAIKSFNKNIEFLVVVGPLNPHYDDIKKYVEEGDLKIRLIKSPKNMAKIYSQSDIAISAGGSSCYELAYFGIPNIIISIADNQLHIAENLDKQKVSIYLGEKENFKGNQLKNKLIELINNQSLRRNMSENGRKLVDGKGKIRIVDFMERCN